MASFAVPTASMLTDVEFGHLTADEIKKISVKRIHVTPTLDSFNNPTPGGLYDPALGCVLDKICTTCRMNSFTCPGHCGHIELAVTCYNVSFLEQTLRLLRSQCAYCHRLKMPAVDVNGYVCRLRLLQYGLVEDLKWLENMHLRGSSKAKSEHYDEGDVEMADEEEEDEEEFMDRRSRFVNACIKKAKKRTEFKLSELARSPTAVSIRKALIKALLLDMSKQKKCSTCGGFSPAYRKDRNSKIFRRPLPEKLKSQMIQAGLKPANPLLYLHSLNAEKLKSKPITNGDLNRVGDVREVDTDDDDSQEDHGAEEQLALNNAAANEEDSKSMGDHTQQYVTSIEVEAAMKLLFQRNQELLDLMYNSRPRRKDDPHVTPEMFFIRNVLVPPNRYRPASKEGQDVLEAQQNGIFTRIIKSNEVLIQIKREMGLTPIEDGLRRRGISHYLAAAVQLQEVVNSLIDQTANPARGIRENGIKQTLEKKEGLFRKNMMGKRVNFAARSVISPDPNIETNEIGVPLVFAKKLTYPEPVTSHNFYEMKDAVINGVDKYPGASAIENELGQVLSLKQKTPDERIALANQLLTPSVSGIKGNMNKKVYRHLRSGDVVLMNRQPTLHKPSIMGHIARVLRNEKTIRMHYANCNTYNADFDGDEMNMHFPQNEIARAEAMQIANTDNQYLSSTAGKPLRGLIQDHISMGVQFTGRDTFFNREDYHQLLYSCLRPETHGTVSERIQLLPPAIIKPRPMWTGKQVISTVLMNIVPPNRVGINLISKSSTPGERWAKNSEEQQVIFQDGFLLCGILDKAQLGPSAGGFIHSIHELYGAKVAGKLLSILGRLLTKFLNMRAWSCGMDDLRLTRAGNAARKEKLSTRPLLGEEVAAKYVTLDKEGVGKNDPELLARLQDVLRDGEKHKGLDQVYNARTSMLSSEITKACLPSGLEKPFPRNQMQAMTISGAKGSGVNANLISCNLGQQVLEGRRVPVMISGKTLPSYQPFETDPAAGGYVSGRFLTGINPKEYYFHAMAGREGLIDTAVKTAKSGYLQRCIIKGLEGVRSEYDNTVRETSTGSVIQFLYGEDGVDVVKSKHLTNFSFLAQNQMSVMADLNVATDYKTVAKDQPREWQKKAMKAVRKTGRVDIMDPVLAQYPPGNNLGSTSETFAKALEHYVEENPDKLIKDKKSVGVEGTVSKKTFRSIMDLKYMRSLVEPGEAVGVVAAQSVGEPSTQMTLNTFHLAGHAAKNVTLGIPRLREIVMTASAKISTPMMTLKLNEELSESDGQTFAKGISRLSLAEVIDEITVKERIGSNEGYSKAKIYDVTVDFYPPEDYTSEYAIRIEDVDRTLRKEFIPKLEKLISVEFRKKARESTLSAVTASVPEIGVSVGQIEEVRAGRANAAADGEGDEVDEDDDADPDAAKQQRERQAEAYDDPEDEDAAVADSSDEDSADSSDETQRKVKKSKSRKPPQNQREENPDDSGDESNSVDSEAEDANQTTISQSQHVTSFKFSNKHGNKCRFTLTYDISISKLLLLPLLEKTARDSIIQSIPGLTACISTIEKTRNNVTGKEGEECVITTSGVNLLAMRDYQHIIQPHSIYTNSIHDMLTHYGVEAARATIVKEMDSVFSGHSISVDFRHLGLIADAMTQTGGYRAFNRMGIVKDQASPFAKMSFETVMGFLREAVLDGEIDDLKGPSSRIVMGRHVQTGTGAFDVYVPVAGEVM